MVKNKTCLFSYDILSVPRFAGDEVDVRVYDSFVGQRGLWNALAFNIVYKHKFSVELRIASVANDRSLNISLRLLGEELTPEILQDIKQVEALLPSDYVWRKNSLAENEIDGSWKIAAIVRKIEYIDLPSVSPMILGMAGNKSRPLSKIDTSAKESNVSKPQNSSYIENIFGSISSPDRMLRELPLPNIPPDFYTKRYTMAMSGQIDKAKTRQRTLYQEFQNIGTGIISLCLHPMDESILEDARIHALNWKRFLDPFAPDIASSGFAEFQHLKAAYDRYSLPASYLANVTIRVATPTDEQSVGLANVVSAYLGGAKAFRIFPPKGSSHSELLTQKDIDVPCESWSKEWIDDARNKVLADLNENGIAKPSDDGSILDFLSIVPHVYTIEEAEQILGLPFADDEGLSGIDSHMIPPFTIPSLNFLSATDENGTISTPPQNKLRIGMVAQGKASICTEDENNRYIGKSWHTIDKIDLTKHALIVGSTGSGKTMSTLFLALELKRLNVPFMVIEPVKTEYYDRLKSKIPNLQRLRLEGSQNGQCAKGFLPFDPLRVQNGVTIARHASYLKSCFEAAFPMEPVISLLLENGLLKYYTSNEKGCCGFGLPKPITKFTRGGSNICTVDGKDVYPSFATFRKYFIESFLPQEFKAGNGQSRAQEFQEVFSRRFSNLGDGLLGECFKAADALTIEDPQKGYDFFWNYLEHYTIIELDAVPDAEQKSLLMAFILTYMFERRQAEDFEYREKHGKPMPNTLRHMMIVEEAHRVLSSSSARGGGRGDLSGQDSKAKAVGLFVDMLAEIRAYGQGLAIVEQIPTKIVPEAVKNTNLKIMLRLTSKDDRDYLGEAMSFTEPQKRFVTNLKVEKGEGINFVVFEEGVDQPLMLKLPLPREQKDDWLYDEFFIASKD